MSFASSMQRVATAFAQSHIANPIALLSSRNQKLRSLVAFAVSVGLHLLIALCLITRGQALPSVGGAGGTSIGGGEGSNFVLIASGTSDRRLLEMRQLLQEEFADLDKAERLDSLAAAEAEIVNETLEPIREDSVLQEGPDGQSQLADIATRWDGEGEGGRSSGSEDALWAAIAPCWRRVADEETLPVNLIVTFAESGALAKPPEIHRDPRSASDSRVLRSESLAMSALAECGVYQMAAGRENVSVTFKRQ